MHVCLCRRSCEHMYTHVCIDKHTYTYASVYTRMCVSTIASLHVDDFMYMFVYVYMCVSNTDATQLWKQPQTEALLAKYPKPWHACELKRTKSNWNLSIFHLKLDWTSNRLDHKYTYNINIYTHVCIKYTPKSNLLSFRHKSKSK